MASNTNPFTAVNRGVMRSKYSYIDLTSEEQVASAGTLPPPAHVAVKVEPSEETPTTFTSTNDDSNICRAYLKSGLRCTARSKDGTHACRRPGHWEQVQEMLEGSGGEQSLRRSERVSEGAVTRANTPSVHRRQQQRATESSGIEVVSPKKKSSTTKRATSKKPVSDVDAFTELIKLIRNKMLLIGAGEKEMTLGSDDGEIPWQLTVMPAERVRRATSVLEESTANQMQHATPSATNDTTRNSDDLSARSTSPGLFVSDGEQGFRTHIHGGDNEEEDMVF